MVTMTVSEYEKGIELLKLGPEYGTAFKKHFYEELVLWQKEQ